MWKGYPCHTACIISHSTQCVRFCAEFEETDKMRKLEIYKRLILIFMSSICIALQMGIYAVFWYGYYSERMYLKFYFKGHLLMLFVYVVLLFFFSQMYGGMRIGYLRAGEVMFSSMPLRIFRCV